MLTSYLMQMLDLQCICDVLLVAEVVVQGEEVVGYLIDYFLLLLEMGGRDIKLWTKGYRECFCDAVDGMSQGGNMADLSWC